MRKVFILGAHRSGTSKLAAYFKEVLGFRGYAEGHIYRLVPHLMQGNRAIQKSIPENAFEINRIGKRTIIDHLVLSLDALISEHHHHEDYYDKTPGFQMLDAAPALHRCLPEARFIHVHRNGIENVASNLRNWERRGFKDACGMWQSALDAWFRVKDRIADRCYEIEMDALKTDSWRIHQEICAHLALENRWSRDEIEAYFGAGSSTSTVPLAPPRAPLLEDMDWSPAQKALFVETCGENMRRCGYWTAAEAAAAAPEPGSAPPSAPA
ncbi:sulfotransferase [Paroceanicella profunda]|uniref:Sulfotransferase n=1 Tax=Paroceanicella profunda TaxID=2579971 RepID=A0A5B8FYM3_9RHOB|nr:sulfotransferase [Paroceanicella profunda]QDL91273.1 sulfotransferase [Paroceanicella profunda]